MKKRKWNIHRLCSLNSRRKLKPISWCDVFWLDVCGHCIFRVVCRALCRYEKSVCAQHRSIAKHSFLSPFRCCVSLWRVLHCIRVCLWWFSVYVIAGCDALHSVCSVTSTCPSVCLTSMCDLFLHSLCVVFSPFHLISFHSRATRIRAYASVFIILCICICICVRADCWHSSNIRHSTVGYCSLYVHHYVFFIFFLFGVDFSEHSGMKNTLLTCHVFWTVSHTSFLFKTRDLSSHNLISHPPCRHMMCWHCFICWVVKITVITWQHSLFGLFSVVSHGVVHDDFSTSSSHTTIFSWFRLDLYLPFSVSLHWVACYCLFHWEIHNHLLHHGFGSCCGTVGTFFGDISVPPTLSCFLHTITMWMTHPSCKTHFYRSSVCVLMVVS